MTNGTFAVEAWGELTFVDARGNADFGWYTGRDATGLLCVPCLQVSGLDVVEGVTDVPGGEARWCSACGVMIVPPFCRVCRGICECLNSCQGEFGSVGDWVLCHCSHTEVTS